MTNEAAEKPRAPVGEEFYTEANPAATQREIAKLQEELEGREEELRARERQLGQKRKKLPEVMTGHGKRREELTDALLVPEVCG